MTRELPANPYSPPNEPAKLPQPDLLAQQDFSRRSWSKSLTIWSLVCIVSAAPSFVWGIYTVAPNQAAAMCLGVLIFICGYTLADQFTQTHRWRRNKALRQTLKIGYVTRLVVSVIFPVGGFLDMFCGLLSVSVVEFLFLRGEQHWMTEGTAGVSFLVTLVITLVQGLVLNLVLAGYMVLIFAVVLLAHRGQTLRPES